MTVAFNVSISDAPLRANVADRANRDRHNGSRSICTSFTSILQVSKFRATCRAEPLFAERTEIVTGKKEAPASAEGEDAEVAEGDVKKETGDVKKEEGEGEEEVPSGVPEFWLNVLRNYEEIGEKVRRFPERAGATAGSSWLTKLWADRVEPASSRPAHISEKRCRCTRRTSGTTC